MTYCIKYVQRDFWSAGLKTDRGWEGFISQDSRTYHVFTLNANSALTFYSLNEAFRYKEKRCQDSNSEMKGGWYYVVEEIEL